MSGNMRNCKLCKRPIEFSAFYMCHNCLQELDSVSSYIKKNPYATVEEISQATSLSSDDIKRIIEFFRQSNPSNKTMKC